jgi:tetrahydromethanopterin S-methyltransferase subunit F
MKKSETVYNVDQALQLSVYVDDQQGFIKSGFGFYDSDRGEETKDNKTAIFQYMNGIVDMPEITDQQKERAVEIREYFKGTLVAKKLMGTLNSFEDGVTKSIGNNETNSFGVSVIASLPNSLRISKKRDDLDNWFDDLRDKSEFIGKRGERLRFGVYVRDVKFIAKYGIHLVTCVDKDDNIVKFFFSKEPDIAGLLEGRNVILTGKVKQHDVSKFSQCKETVINYVRVEESA